MTIDNTVIHCRDPKCCQAIMDPHAWRTDWRPRLHAVEVGDLHVLRQMDPDTLSADDNGWTPAHLAAMEGHVEVIRYLHEVVPDTLSAMNNKGSTPAHSSQHQRGRATVPTTHVCPPVHIGGRLPHLLEPGIPLTLQVTSMAMFPIPAQHTRASRAEES